ncbi:hypothetical protein C7M84_009380 [Penaeus vannamei]|uniref:Proton-coupled folate transporter n=1 Tax=Penaeus vannamei TaxID=6689 RepID=A0A3R7PXC6_PENVA|nr:hypothetical protein C7M84_009380 [Penaeus vannamei]
MLFARNVALYGMSVIRENLKLDRFCRLTLNRTQDECAHMNDGEHDDLQVAVQKLDNAFILFESLVGSLVPILLVVFIASWSDRRGRKVPLVISLSGSALYAAVYLLEAVNPSWPPEVLLLASFLQSVGGGWVLFFMAAYSYIADHSSGESRTLRLTVMSAIWQLGGPAGTALAAWLFDVGGYAWVFGLSLALYVLCLLYTLLVVRDKAPGPAEGRPRAQAGGGGPCDVRNILDLFRACFRRRPGRGRLHLLLAMTFMLGAYSSGAHNMYLWTRRVLGWGSDQYSLYSTVNQLCQQGVMLLTAPLLRRLRVHDCVVGAGAALVNMRAAHDLRPDTTPARAGSCTPSCSCRPASSASPSGPSSRSYVPETRWVVCSPCWQSWRSSGLLWTVLSSPACTGRPLPTTLPTSILWPLDSPSTSSLGSWR